VGHPNGKSQPCGAARQAEDQALREHGAHQPAAARAEGGSDAPLALLDRGTRQQEVGDIGARQEEEEQSCGHQYPGGGKIAVVPEPRIVQGGPHQGHTAPAAGQRSRLVQGAPGEVESVAGLFERHSRSEPPEEKHPPPLPVVEPRQAGNPVGLRQRHVEGRGVAMAPEAFGHDADESEELPVEPQRPADRSGVSSEHPLPEAVAGDDHRLGARSVVRGLQQPPPLRPCTEEGEVLAADHVTPGELRRLAVAHRGGENGEADHVPDGRLLPAQVEVVGVGSEGARFFGCACIHPNHALRLRSIERWPDDRGEVGEERRAGADAKSQRQHHDRDHSWLAGEGAQRDGEVLGEAGHGAFHVP
jgi:hypothetical protein